MGTINALPGSHPLSKGSDRSGPSHAGFFGFLRQATVRVLTGVGIALVRWQRNHEDRIALRTMEPRLLKDIGISREEADTVAQRLAARPFHHHDRNLP